MPNAQHRNAFFTRAEARRALKVLDAALDTEEGFQFARECGAVAAIGAALIILNDYLVYSKAAIPNPGRTREELYADHVHSSNEQPKQAGARAT